jgi:hypothetical protein
MMASRSLCRSQVFFLFLRRSPARPVEEHADGGMVHVRELGHRANPLHLPLAENDDAVGHLPQQVKIVRDHDDGQTKQVA